MRSWADEIDAVRTGDDGTRKVESSIPPATEGAGQGEMSSRARRVRL